jgi:hypothetical protein
MARRDSKRIAVVNEPDRKISKANPRAKLTAHEIDLLRELHEQGMGYKQIAKRFKAPSY